MFARLTREAWRTRTRDDVATVQVRPVTKWIAFQGTPRGISLIRADGTGSHVILGPPGDQNHPDWSPDGSEIAYVQYDGSSSAAMITDLEGGNPRPVVESVPADLEGLFWENPAWSRDGTEIAMIGYDGDPNSKAPARSVLAVAEVATGELALADGLLHSFPRWSPDGQAMASGVSASRVTRPSPPPTSSAGGAIEDSDSGNTINRGHRAPLDL